MINKTLEIKAALQMLKPVNEVFNAIIDPVKMSNYKDGPTFLLVLKHILNMGLI